MTFGSLFAGIGGMDLGLERAGLRCAWQVEIDEFCRKVLAKHWPDVRRWNDARTFPPDGDWRCDVIAGGFPCKQTSTIAAVQGNRTGLQGEDSGLWFELLRVVRLLRPAWVVVENVGGALKWKAAIKGGLEDVGYRVPDRPLEVSAESLGAPHSRRRVFWIADLDGKGLEITRQGGPSAAETRQRRAADGNPWLANLTGAWGVDDRAAHRVDRINALGNAVVPAIAEWIGRRIVEASKGEA